MTYQLRSHVRYVIDSTTTHNDVNRLKCYWSYCLPKVVFLTALSALNGIPKNMKLVTSTLQLER